MLLPDICTPALNDSLRLCAERLIPSIFPFLVVNAIFSSSGGINGAARMFGGLFSRLFGTSGALCVPFLVGLISGFPSGAESVADIYQKNGCTKDEAERALSFCSNTGPAFAIAGIGGLLGNIKYGMLIYTAQILSSWICALLLKKKKKTELPLSALTDVKNSPSFIRAVTGSVIPMLNICAFVLIFSPIAALCDHALSSIGTSQTIRAFCICFIEITNAAAFTASNLPIDLALPICSFAVCWSGLCVYSQTAAAVTKEELSLKYYLAGKLFMGICAFIITRISVLFLSWC
ncbi:MAG: hypothetical protein IJC50_04660 [Clostridia bacterium]|nr:hypothetical protein [Clostridia bacterium]